VPAVGGGDSVVGVGDGGEAIGWILGGKRNDSVLPNINVVVGVCVFYGLNVTYARISNEGDHVDYFTSTGINESLIPLVSLVILNLNNVCEHNVIGVLGKVLNKYK
jgi:hypothetical protein